MYLTLAALAACAICTIYIFVKMCHSYWEKHGIPYAKTSFFFGNLKETGLGKKNLGVAVTEIYNQFKDYKYVGFYKFLDRAVLIRDPELIGDVMVKDFTHFADNEIEADENVDFITSRHIFVLKGHQWKSMRSLITPMFSSGKLKFIFPLVEEVSQRLISYMNKEIDAGRGKCVDGKILCTKFTTDNVASCAFGLNGQAFEGESQFVRVVRDFANESYWNSMKLMLIFVFPSLSKILKLKFFKDYIEEYLTEVVSETLRYRKENNIVRNDFLDHISQLKEKSKEYPFTDRDVVAQGASFFIDGVETSAGVLSYVLYEIARHPEVQKKLRDEIVRCKAKQNNEITYEAISEMNYLDCVINESLRINAPAMALFKVCTKTYTLPDIEEGSKTQLVLNPGDSIIIPVSGLHTDPNYFSDPETFNPERFSDENKLSILKNTYLPFGNGPRFCIGMRFGLMQIKVAVVALLSNFQIDINDKMLPYEVHPSALLRSPKKGFWFDFTKLTKS